MRVTFRARRALLVGVLAALAGCATRPPPEADRPWTSGRITINVEASADKPAQRVTAEFDLRGDARRGELQLSSTVGTRFATLSWSADEAVLDTGSGPVRYRDLESLSRAALGEPLPLQALPDWLAGRPWSGADSQAVEGGFQQMGWRVGLAARSQGRIEARREAPPRVSVVLRLEDAAR